MAKFAQGTTVDVTKSQAEVQRMIRAHPDFKSFGTQDTADAAHIVFQLGFSVFRMTVPMPDPSDAEFWSTPSRRQRRSKDQAYKAYEAEYKRRWRALVLSIKAKLTAIDEGISTFEHEFLPHMVAANGQTVGDILRPRMIEAMKTDGQLMLPAPNDGGDA